MTPLLAAISEQRKPEMTTDNAKTHGFALWPALLQLLLFYFAAG
jgi:hypothetical protein